jgi:hypothetical protein
MPQLDKQDQRIADIFGTQDVPEVDTETLEHYLDHLQRHVALPCQLTGIEDFDWEEYYVIGPGSKAEHERLRKTRPSYMDTYDLLSFEKEVDPDEAFWSTCVVSPIKRNFSYRSPTWKPRRRSRPIINS